MDQQTLELLRTLQSSERDAQTFERIGGMLTAQRSQLVAEDDRATLADLSELLEVWADTAAPPLAAAAITHAAQIAEDLGQAERAIQLYVLGLERSPQALETLDRLDALLCRREERERLETVLAMHAKALGAQPNVDPEQPARVLRRLGQLRAERGLELGPAIDAYEQALDLAAESDTIRALAELYAKRGGVGDAQQAADLYCTLGDVTGPPEGAAMLERALELAPDHDAALDLLESYVPVAEQSARLKHRWAGYVERSDNESGVDKRRLLLARAHAADSQFRDALICLGPLVDKGEPEAVRLQAAFLANLQEGERKSDRPGDGDGDAAKSGNGAPTVRRPSTLVGFRLPTGQGVPEVAEPPPADLAVAESAPSEEASEPLQFGTTARNAGAAIRGGTLVGFRVPPASESAAAAPASVAELATSSSDIDAPSAPPSAAAIQAAVASAKAASAAPLAARSAGAATSVPTQERVQRAKRSPSADAPAASTARAPLAKRSSAPARRTASASPAPQRPSVSPAQGAAAKAAALRAARESAPPARNSAAAAVRTSSTPPPLKRASSPSQRPAAQLSPAPAAASPVAAASGPAAFAATLPLIHTTPEPAALAMPEAAAEYSLAAAGAPLATPAVFPAPGVPAMPAIDSDVSAFGARARRFDPRWLAAGGVAAVALLVGLIWSGLGDPDQPAESAAARASSQPAGASTAVRPASSGPAAVAPATSVPAAPATTAAPVAPAAATTLAAAVTPPAPTPARVPARRAPDLEVEAGQVKVRGGQLSAKAVTSALDDGLAKLERCYADAVERTPRLEGRITFGFSIDKSGRAAKVRKVSSTIKDAGLQRCSSEVIEKTRFPKAKKRAAQVTLPLSYEKR